MSDAETPKDDDVVSGLPNEEAEAQPLGPAETDPDAKAPPEDDLPGVPSEGEEPPTDG